MNRLLVLYASHFGQTRAIAHAIVERLRELGDHVEIADADASDLLPSPDNFDAVVAGSRIELGRHAPAIATYLRKHRDRLQRIPTAFFSVSMAASTPKSTDPNGYLATFFDDLGWKPTVSVAIGGALPYRKYNWFLRFVMQRISRAAGHETDTSKNHEFTDWTAVRTFADDVHALLPGSVARSIV